MPAVAQRTLEALGLNDETPGEFLDTSSVAAKQNSDLIELKVADPSRTLAARLATEYARQFTLFRLELDTAALQRARAEVDARISDLEAAGDSDSDLHTSLVEKEQQLRTMEALQTSNAFVVRPADRTEQAQPRTHRNVLLGGFVGLAVGIALAFLRHALDTRVRSGHEIGARLGLPLLARIPAPRYELRSKNQLVMVHEASGPEAEAFRILRTNLEFVNLERGARMIMVTSAVQSEGKSTTVANLAVALARAGHRVILVDLDLRRPYIGRFFGLTGRPGVTDVALGSVGLDQAIVRMVISKPPTPESSANGNGGVRSGPDRVLQVLPTGPLPPDVGEFVGSAALSDVLDNLRERADFVLVDAPPLLNVGDGLALSARVDALIVVTRLRVVRQEMLGELRRVLDASPAPVLGFVVTDAAQEEGYGRGYPYGYEAHRQPVHAERVR
jgi:Mrp family chromosome partitioning ATPase/capsular polysaccharide biosynthesis protein